MHSGYRMVAVSCFILLAGCSEQTSTQESALTVEEVAPGIYVHGGLDVPFDDEHADDIANIGFIVGSDCVAVIDTGGSVKIGEQLKQTIAATTDAPVCYVINTHVHYDHVLGNKAFNQDDVEFIGPEGLTGALVASKPFFIEQYPQYMGEPPDAALVLPEREVSDRVSLDLGGREIVLRTWPSAHTSHDLTVYDPTTQTLWVSDLLFMERIPALDGSLTGWLAVMDELAKIPAKRVVPGHGPVVADWPQALAAQRKYLTALLEQTRAAIANGVFLGKALDTVATEEAKHWLLSDQHHRRNISHAYRELEWE